jgi:hypothetical protein
MMEIQYGMQPNCSELVIYVNETYADAKDILEAHKIREMIAQNFYEYGDKKVGDWDEEKIDKKIIEAPKEVLELLHHYDYGTDADQKAASKKLEDLGYNPWKSTVMLIEEGKDPDVAWEYGGTVTLRDGHDNHNEAAIVGHQHCQAQIYPLMKRIAEIFDSEVQGYDGGSSEQYEQWLEEGCPDPNTWEYE